MDTAVQKEITHNRVKWYKSLSFTIALWFLPLAMIPVLLISYSNYIQSVKDIKETVYDNIEQATLLEKNFILNWFYYREVDIKNWSQNTVNVEFLEELIYSFKEMKLPVADFVKSDASIDVSINMQEDMLRIVKNYKYVYDLFLIDTEGNILYTVEKESDLGTNLVDGPYAKTKFAATVRKTLKDKKVHFSDLEHYAPSNNTVAGFLTAPIYDDDHIFIGVYAVQIKLDRIYKIFTSRKNMSHEYSHYIVGEDVLLRSSISKDSEILKLKIETQQFQRWSAEHGKHGVHLSDEKEAVFSYKNAYGQEVYGIHQDINILGLHWALIGETNISLVENLKVAVIERTLFFFLGMLFFVLLLSIFISKILVKPIIALTDVTNKFESGARDIDVQISSNNEIGLLARTFERMMATITKSEEKLDEQKFALNAHSIVAITDIKGSITYVNDKFVEINGYSREELLGKNHRLLNSGDRDKEYWRSMYATLAQGSVWHDEIRNLSKNGEEYWVDTTIVPFMYDGKPKSYIAIRTDITQKKQDEFALIEAKAVAEESVQAKSEFFASMSHEIRTPMNGVIGMLGLLLNSELSKSQEHQAYLAQSSAKALLNLINDILDYSKVEAGKLELESAEFKIRDDFGDFAEAIAYGAQEKGIAVILDMRDVDVDRVIADSYRIRQILNNLVSNAIKFTEKGYVLIKVSLSKIDDINATLSISVKDTGIGIPQDKIGSLFDSFTQVDASTTRKYGGTGLGLSIVKKLANLMDGDVSASSVTGEGSEFKLKIRVQLSLKGAIVTPDVVVKGKRVAIFDKCVVSKTVLTQQLQYWGMDVDEHEATTKAYDIAFIAKDEAAFEIAKALRASRASIKLVLMTSLKDTANVTECMEGGFDTHFPQPATTLDMLGSLMVLSDKYEAPVSYEDTEATEQTWPEDTKILLVDDNKVNQLVANGILEEMGLEADVAADGLIALEALKNAQDAPYDIILMDCQMPNLDGYDTTRAIRKGEAGEVYRKTKVIAMTANAMEGDKEKCYVSGMDDYLSKPIDPEKLEAMLRKYLVEKA